MPELTPGNGTDVEAELGDWLHRFASTYAAEASIFTMWSEAITRDGELGEVSSAVVDGARARLARHLEPRGLGRRRRRRHGAAHLPRRLHLTARHPSSRSREFAQMIDRGLLTGPGAAPSSNGKVERPATRARKPTVKARGKAK